MSQANENPFLIEARRNYYRGDLHRAMIFLEPIPADERREDPNTAGLIAAIGDTLAIITGHHDALKRIDASRAAIGDRSKAKGEKTRQSIATLAANGFNADAIAALLHLGRRAVDAHLRIIASEARQGAAWH